MPEHAVIVRYALPGDGFGEVEERQRVHELEKRLADAIVTANVANSMATRPSLATRCTTQRRAAPGDLAASSVAPA